MANEKRSRTNLAAGALSASLAIGGTTMSSAGLADLGVIDTTNHAAITLFVADSNGRITSKEIVYVTAHTAAATTATIVRAQEGTTAAAWSAGATWAHAGTTRDLAGKAAHAKRTSGNFTTANTGVGTFTVIDSGLDLTLPAQAGDLVQVGLDCFAARTTGDISFDFGTLVSGSIVNRWAGGSAGIQGAYAALTGTPVNAAYFRTLVSGDITAGTVVVRLLYATAGASQTIFAVTANPLHVWAMNYGPQVA